MPSTPKTLRRILDSITQESTLPAEGSHPIHAAHVQKVRATFEDPNIVGIGIGNKITQRTEVKMPCICFYVARKRPPSKVSTRYMVPPVLAGSDGRSTFTDVKEMGEFVPSMAPLVQQTPIESGFSVGHADSNSAGTLGAIVVKDGRHYLLSNSHVLAQSGLATRNARILYPGPADGGRDPEDWIATLTKPIRFVPGGALVNEVDAAIAEILDSRLADVAYGIAQGSVPLTTAPPRHDMVVTIRGRTSDVTHGRIVDVDCCPIVNYTGVGDVGFVRQVLCERYTKEGDSGALVLDSATGSVVGLHFAHAKGGSVFSPIQAVIKALQFSFATI